MNSLRYLFVMIALLIAGCGSDELLEGDDMGQRRTSWAQGGLLIPGNRSLAIPMQVGFGQQGEGSLYTVQFNVNYPVVPGTSQIFQATATIDWQVNGNTARRVVSVVDGMAVSGTAESVNVIVRDSSYNYVGAPVSGPNYTLQAQVSRGSRATSAVPPFLYQPLNGGATFDGLLAPGDSETVPIPIDVGVNSVMITCASLTATPAPIPQNAIRVTQFFPGGFALNTYDPRDFQWVPIVPGATDLSVFLDSTFADSVRYAVFWGIEG